MSDGSGLSSDGRKVRPRDSSAFCEATHRTSRAVATPARPRGSCVVLCLIEPMRRHNTSPLATTAATIRDTAIDPVFSFGIAPAYGYTVSDALHDLADR